MRRILLTCAAAGAAVAALHAQNRAPAPAPGEIEILPVHGSVYMLAGGGGNITASVGKDGVLVVDSGTAETSDKVVDLPQPVGPTTAQNSPGSTVMSRSRRAV